MEKQSCHVCQSTKNQWGRQGNREALFCRNCGARLSDWQDATGGD